MSHKVSKITHLFALSLLPLLAIFSSCGGEEPIEPQEPEETMPEGVYHVQINPIGIWFHVGDSAQLTAIIYPSDAADQRVSWESDNPSVADVDENGYVTAYEVGSTIVRVKTYDGGHVSECEVTVLPIEPIEVKYLDILRSSIILQLGEEFQLESTVRPSNTTENVVWSSSNTSVATVSDGKVTAIKGGKSTITLSTEDGRLEDRCEVTVEDYIKFADYSAESWCVEHFDTNDDREVSYDEAAAVQDLTGLYFDSSIKTFDEFQYFINVTFIPDEFFATHLKYSTSKSRLESIILPKSIKSIGKGAFYQCNNLTKIEFSEGLEEIGFYAFRYCTGLTEVKFPKSLKIIKGFDYCTGLTKVEFSEEVESIAGFRGCTGLTEVKFPKSLKNIADGAFWGCTGLTKVDFPEGLETIRTDVFGECTGLTEVELPKSLKTIGSGAFWGCTGLTKVYCKPLTPPALLTNVDHPSPSLFTNNCRIYVPRNSVELYKVADVWKDCDIRGYDF